MGMSVTKDLAANQLILKAVNPSEDSVQAAVKIEAALVSECRVPVTLLAGRKDDENMKETPDKVVPLQRVWDIGSRFKLELPAMSLQVLRIPLGRWGRSGIKYCRGRRCGHPSNAYAGSANPRDRQKCFSSRPTAAWKVSTARCQSSGFASRAVR